MNDGDGDAFMIVDSIYELLEGYFVVGRKLGSTTGESE
jgi:hypothetical protein